MAHKSRYCLDIFLCLHIVNNSCCVFLFVWYYVALLLPTSFLILCYHCMWITPRMLYIQYVDMHLYSSFFLIWTVHIFSTALIEFLSDWRLNLCNHFRPFKPRLLSWRRWHEKLALTRPFDFSSAVTEREGKCSPPPVQTSHTQPENYRGIFEELWVCLYLLHMYEIMDVL